jgi:hypothetical protein
MDETRNNGPSTGTAGYRKPPVEHQFKPGNPGRPKGSRNKLGEAFLEKLLEDFAEHGVEAIAACRTNSPETYVRVIAGILPKEIQAEVTQRFVARLPTAATTTDEWLAQNNQATAIQ